MGVHWTVYTPRPDYHNIKGKPGQVYAATICCNVLHAHCALHTRLEFTVYFAMPTVLHYMQCIFFVHLEH